MIQVFATIHYDVLGWPDIFNSLYKFIGHFQIQQSVKQSHDKVFEIWFFTDKVDIKEGELRQVDLVGTKDDLGVITWKIEKI